MEAFEVETKVESSRESSQPEAQRSSLFSAYANTTSTILGAGTLAVPIAMSSAGVVSYALITIFVIMVNSQTATWLVRVADHLPKSEGNAGKNYEGIAKSYLGTRAAHLISLVFVFSGLSVGMSRMLFSADCLAPLFATWLAEPERPTLKLIQRMERRVLWAAGFGLVLPLGLLRDISKLQSEEVEKQQFGSGGPVLIILGPTASFPAHLERLARKKTSDGPPSMCKRRKVEADLPPAPDA